ncbi:ATP-binding cassette domain-containing protein [Paenibacillus harenae]|uniref:ATP-binding cassette domain-containing protein n=1 Tax=Paenibacillus harenae TaxID=306543 RepID=UPI00279490D9|nr:ATP-binding cassette domain-containing protein [Paenibacillus harenae]MDQ0062676.1 sulfonate transport system ATP-binding protein [Paenibacillus harenae]
MASPLRQSSAAVEEFELGPGPARQSVLKEEASARGVSIKLDGVSKRFGEKTVLNDLNLSIEPGKFIAIVGRSGCGKSTLLRLLAGLDGISSGSLTRQDQPIAGINQDTRFMFQDARLLPWQTVLENVKIGLTVDKSAEAERKAYAALQLVGLADRAKEWPSVLSGGQRQRVALARALVGHPHLLLFDEPLGALDAVTRIDMQRLIERLWQTRGFTAVLVTHDVSEAVALADRVILIDEGRAALDIPITLARPRVKDSGFAHFEKLILDRLLTPAEQSGTSLDELDFDI